MAGEGWKTNADTTKMSPEEISKLNLHSSKRPPGKSPGGVLHQQGAGLSRAGSYPVALTGVLVLTGLASWIYYRSILDTHPTTKAGRHSPTIQQAEENSKKATQG